IIADFFLQVINAGFTLLLNFLMLEHGFKDYEIAGMVGNRYLTVLLCSVPLALWAKGRRMKPFLLAGSVLSPIVALLIIFGIHTHNSGLIRLLMSLWGISFSLLQVLAMPYILLNGKRNKETSAIALFFAVANISIILTGSLSFALPHITSFFNTERLLILFCLSAFAGIYFIQKLPDEENISKAVPVNGIYNGYDWNLIFEAAIPTFLIAFGAGFTIPVINLFFYDVHGMDAVNFSLMSTATFFLVTLSGLLVPEVKIRFGYRTAITGVQSVAIVLLFVLATTEWYTHVAAGLWVAIISYTLRQPLMNMAAPITGELTMKYVGEKNRELVSAINTSIWSGCWFASAKIFAILREAGVSYSNIIFITVGCYIFGVWWYHRLIRKVEQLT
ncbi:MAG: hypothetical protein NZ522_07895, partial [Chitinophagales bacterium]|nr:hypothetical protein [Chitinophagales bacterium]